MTLPPEVTQRTTKPSSQRIKDMERTTKANYRSDMEKFIAAGGKIQVFPSSMASVDENYKPREVPMVDVHTDISIPGMSK